MADYKHLFIEGLAKAEKYKILGKPIKGKPLPIRNRFTHSEKLLKQFEAIWAEKERINQKRFADQITTREGTYLSFTSTLGHELITKSLERFNKDLKKSIRLLNVKEKIINDEVLVQATVYIPNGMEGFFIKKILDYQDENKSTKNGKPKNEKLVTSIEDVSIALLEGLWTDNLQLIPTENSKWCEVWLNVNTNENREQEQIASFLTILENTGIEFKNNSIIFPERAVLLINANRTQLIELILQSDLLAEFRAGQEPSGFWVNESAIEQQAWVEDLLLRLEQIESNIKICILDTGVNIGHQLLQPLIDNANTLAVNNAWGTNDHEIRTGHGTLMAGIAGYGQMEEVLTTANKIYITHKLCSVKILPPHNQEQTPKELWGDITAQGISRAEIQNPEMQLIYCMAVTSKEDAERGRPSSWSGAIDNLAFGEGENQKFIIISGGNIRDEDAWKNYPNSNFVTTIENPAQSWNALCVGAYTEKIKVTDEKFKDYTPIANVGELSPYSSTSLIWEKMWPIKPDVVFEGGNLLKAPNDFITTHEDLELLSTSKSFNIKPFDTLNATSAAAAQASWFAAKVAFEYPNAWPETLRGLMIHSANWNPAMFNQMNVKAGNRGDFRNLLKVFGFGIPELNRALYSQESALTFIAQETIQPFGYNDKNVPETNEIHFFNFPWPKDLLLEMGETPIRLRITLSYFVEPGAGEIGWKDKYRYQSHGLRFDINNIGEDEDDFRKRVNIEAREENEEVNGNSGSNRWSIGTNNRSNGSVHSDFWDGIAADLATCNLISVFPVIGWWRERKHLGKVETKTRYSLIISLDTPAQDIELYTTIKNMIEVPIEIKT
ncbi:S8 family peptidase [Sediminibacterium sp.]|uniref:S8 family peptidase n=1 Tax=Sediminibacterium sp. TaxID=1917865 RepID=UPI0025D7CE50|nr:S8 family peptidase [Sediminibacterium sp.]